MKKYIVTGLVCALAISAAGCGAKETETGFLMEPIPAENGETGAPSETAPAQTETQTTTETSGNKTPSGKADTQTDNKTSSEKSDAQADSAASTSDLYEVFKQGTGTVRYRGTGDRTGYIETASILEVGKAYTLDELIEACKTTVMFIEDSQTDVTYRNIDCGQDGVPELLVNIGFGGATSITIIMKEINNELVMCFDQDGGDRYYVDVKDNGMIESGGSSGANVHNMDYAYVDGNGDYHFYYGVSETIAPYDEYYAYKSGEDYVIIPVDGIDAEHIGIRDYYFEADYKDRNHIYNYFVINDSYEDVTTDADYDDSNLLKQRFKEAGITPYTQAKMEHKLSERAKEIGYPGQ